MSGFEVPGLMVPEARNPSPNSLGFDDSVYQPSGGIGGTASDIKIQAEQMMYTKTKMAELIAVHTGQSYETIKEDSDRDRWFNAEDAKAYGFVDHVVTRASDVGTQA